MFCNFDLLISPHTSQLTNLVFAPSWAWLIEIQPQNTTIVEHGEARIEHEATFQQKAKLVGMHQLLLKAGNVGVPRYPWRRADMNVGIAQFEKALELFLQDMRAQGRRVGSGGGSGSNASSTLCTHTSANAKAEVAILIPAPSTSTGLDALARAVQATFAATVVHVVSVDTR
jgi:hypothetical protein